MILLGGILYNMSDHQVKPTNDDQIVVQLNRIRGQIDGQIKMYHNKRSCVDIVRQVIAARNSLARVARDLLSQEASRCSQERRAEDLDEIIKELFKY